MSFNVDSGLYEYVCDNLINTNKLIKVLNDIIVNKSYEEQNSYNIIAQLLIPLVVYELKPCDFEFDLESKDRTKTSLIKKVNTFILKILRNRNPNKNFDLNILKTQTHQNYLKYRIFYTIENFLQMIK